MEKIIFALLTFLVAVPALASNRVLYFVVDQGGNKQVVSVSMEGAYDRVLNKKDDMTCTFKTVGGASAEFSLSAPHCPGDTTSMSISLVNPTADGHQTDAYTETGYIDHKYIYLLSSLDGNPGIGLTVASATNYANIPGVPAMNSVPSAQVSLGPVPVVPAQQTPGTWFCSTMHVEAQCQN